MQGPGSTGPRKPETTLKTDDGYELLDSGHGRKLERFGPYLLERPCAQAVWQTARDEKFWQCAHASFDREGGNRWHNRSRLPAQWVIRVEDIRLRLSGTDFGHLGVFPEQRSLWRWVKELVCQRSGGAPVRVLNLFAYSGGASLAAAQAGAEVCHLDASLGMVNWARENATLNGLQQAPIRWIVDDALKFLKRETRRRQYDAIILDPPSFGRGARGEVYKIERDLEPTLQLCRQLLSDQPLLILLSAHTPGLTPIVLENLLGQLCAALPGRVDSGEMLLTGGKDVLPVPSGAYARWVAGHR